MDTSREIREKMVQVIGNLISRCLEDARNVPWVVPKDQLIAMVIEKPEEFEALVEEEQRSRSELSREELTVRFDALAELGQLRALDQIDISFEGSSETDEGFKSAVELIHRMTQNFIVYTSNSLAIFEKEFESFAAKYRSSLSGRKLVARTLRLDEEDLRGLLNAAGPYFSSGEFIQAFSFDHLLNSRVIPNDFVDFPRSGLLLSRHLIKGLLPDSSRFPELARFTLRACYVSQGSWMDLFGTLLSLVRGEQASDHTALLVNLIEQDAFFTCNLLRDSFANLRSWQPARRRAAIENALQSMP